ncbi:MAG: rod shape-determining protein RodA [Alphaproteobacteria bacterium]|nr:rod shape-determining protein RodA [Alphaproteobacteria bacterium]
MALSTIGGPERKLSIGRKLWEINWGLVLLVCLVASVGFAMLYSAAGGSLDPWASRQMIRFGVGLVLMLAIAVIDLRFWLKFAYPAYAVAVLLLVAVMVFGTIGMGARRWIDLGPFNIQPSEVMKIALILALARYFHGLTIEEVGKIRWLLIPVAMILLPAGMVMKQPDLGTALLLIMTGGIILFFAGVRLWKFALALGAGLGAIPIAWQLMHDYQRRRVLTFLDPENDPLGSGYHILQSKIALGSGHIFGKGFLQGTQAHLNFLPEKQTDFIFTTLAEEMGMAGALTLIALYVCIFAYGLAIALRARHQYGRLVAAGFTGMFFLYVFINVAMVTGLVPVVGVPLPLVSYGGTSMMTLLVGLGLLLNVYVHRDLQLPRRLDGGLG